LVDFGRLLADIWPTLADFWPTFGRLWPTFDRSCSFCCPGAARFSIGSGNQAPPGQQKERHWPTLADFGRLWPTFGRLLADFWSTLADFGRLLADFWTTLADFGRHLADVSPFVVLVKPASNAWLLYKRESAIWGRCSSSLKGTSEMAKGAKT